MPPEADLTVTGGASYPLEDARSNIALTFMAH